MGAAHVRARAMIGRTSETAENFVRQDFQEHNGAWRKLTRLTVRQTGNRLQVGEKWPLKTVLRLLLSTSGVTAIPPRGLLLRTNTCPVLLGTTARELSEEGQ
jgi:hypothetical protein